MEIEKLSKTREGNSKINNQINIAKKILIFLLFFGSVYFLHSDNERIQFNHLTVNDGLSQGSVFAIIQDHRGFMWFGTKDGLNRFDGYNFVIYRNQPGVESSISNSYILTLIEDKKGFLWIGTRGGGLCRFDPSTNLFKTFRYNPDDPDSISGNMVNTIYEDSDGILWIGTNMNGINRFNTDSEKFKRIKNIRLNNTEIKKITTIKGSGVNKKHLWIGTNKGLYSFNKKTSDFKYYSLKESSPSNKSDKPLMIRALKNIDNHLWITANWDGVIKFNPILNTVQKLKVPFRGENTIVSIHNDDNKNVWLGTLSSGIIKYNNETKQIKHIDKRENDDTSLIFSKVLSIYRSKSGMIWIGTHGSGISYYYPHSGYFSLLSKKNKKMSFASTRSISEDNQEKLWISGYNGINIIKKDSKLSPVHIQRKSAIYSLLHDPVKSNILWIGNEGGGLYLFDKNKMEILKQFNSTSIIGENKILGRSIYAITYSRGETFWIGSILGLSKYERKQNKVTHYTHNSVNNSTIANGSVKTLFNDKKGNLWIGTDTGGISKLNIKKNEFTNYRHDHFDKNSISSNDIKVFCLDRNKTLWVGTTGGLNRFDDKTQRFVNYTTRDGLPNDTIYGILEDNKGYLWLSTNRGLSKFDPVNEKFKNYDSSYGLQSNEFNTAAFFKSKDNTFYFGGIEGVSYFNPEEIIDNPYKPPIVFTSFKKFGTKVPLKTDISKTKEIELNYKDQMISFEFAALNYYNPVNNHYSYKIEGLNEEWINLGDKRYISITKLPHGNYTLKIKGSNNDGVWNDKALSLGIKIKPPIWITTWFRITSILFLSGFIGLIIFYRFNLLKKLNLILNKKIQERTSALELAKNEAEKAHKVKSEFLANISHEIRTPLNAVLGYSEMLKESIKNKKHSNYIQSIISNGSSLLTLMNDILDFSKIEADKIEIQYKKMNLRDLLTNIGSTFSFQIEEKKLNYYLNLAKEIPPYIVFDEFRLKQVLLNLIGNAVKFTESGFVKVSINKINNKKDLNHFNLEILIEDSGIGIPKNQHEFIFDPFVQKEGQDNKYGGTGLGLSISKRLIELMDGKIEIKEKTSKGALFTVIFRNIKIAQAGESRKVQEKNKKINQDTINNNSKEINSVLTILKEKWKNIQKRFIIEEIEAFGEEILNTGEKYLLDSFIEWGLSIKEQTKNMELTELANTMNNFPVIISQINEGILQEKQ